MIIKIIAAVVIGILCGYLGLNETYASSIQNCMTIGLCALLFFVGIDIGRTKGIFDQIKQLGFKVLGIPAIVAVMSLLGGIIAGKILGYNIGQSGVVAGGLGWYTLSAVIIAPYSAEMSALAFLANVTRELFAIITIPIIAKYIGKIEALAPTGATGMDTLLPVVSKAAGPSMAIVCFLNGFILTVLVPIIVPLFIPLM